MGELLLASTQPGDQLGEGGAREHGVTLRALVDTSAPPFLGLSSEQSTLQQGAQN